MTLTTTSFNEEKPERSRLPLSTVKGETGESLGLAAMKFGRMECGSCCQPYLAEKKQKFETNPKRLLEPHNLKCSSELWS